MGFVLLNSAPLSQKSFGMSAAPIPLVMLYCDSRNRRKRKGKRSIVRRRNNQLEDSNSSAARGESQQQ
jgi:hypothetical protein